MAQSPKQNQAVKEIDRGRSFGRQLQKASRTIQTVRVKGHLSESPDENRKRLRAMKSKNHTTKVIVEGQQKTSTPKAVVIPTREKTKQLPKTYEIWTTKVHSGRTSANKMDTKMVVIERDDIITKLVPLLKLKRNNPATIVAIPTKFFLEFYRPETNNEGPVTFQDSDPITSCNGDEGQTPDEQSTGDKKDSPGVDKEGPQVLKPSGKY